MGFAPQQVDGMGAWEFHACVKGWNRAHGGAEDPAPGLSLRELRDMGIEGV